MSLVTSLINDEFVRGFLSYGFIHGGYAVLGRMYDTANKSVQTERAKIIKEHVHSGHGDSLAYCFTDRCSTLSSQVA